MPIDVPLGNQENSILQRNLNRLEFLTTMKRHGLLGHEKSKGLIVYADDQNINLTSMKLLLDMFGVADKLVTCTDGKAVCEYFDSLLADIQLN